MSNRPTWLQTRLPNARALDVNWTMERYDFPDDVRKYIFENWIKVSEVNGGTFCEPEYYKNLPPNHKYKTSQIQNEQEEEKEEEEKEEETNFFQNFKDNNPSIYNQMDDNNKNVLDIGAKEGPQAMYKEMFKHPETGRELSYGEMRMYYG